MHIAQLAIPIGFLSLVYFVFGSNMSVGIGIGSAILAYGITWLYGKSLPIQCTKCKTGRMNASRGKLQTVFTCKQCHNEIVS